MRLPLRSAARAIEGHALQRRRVDDLVDERRRGARQGRFAHFADQDVEHFQGEVDKMREKWLIPGVIPFTIAEKDATLLRFEKTPLHAQTKPAVTKRAS